MSNTEKIESIKSRLWGISTKMRGTMSVTDSANALLLFLILRRLECMFEPYRNRVMKLYNQYKDVVDRDDLDFKVRKVIGGEIDFYILSASTMGDLLSHGYLQGASGLEHYIDCFDARTARQLKEFGAIEYASKLMYDDLYYFVVDSICYLELGNSIDAEDFEGIVIDLLSSSSNHQYTSSELSRLMATLLLDDKKDGSQRLYDPTCGTGNLLRMAQSVSKTPLFASGQDMDPKMSSFNALLSKTTNQFNNRFAIGNALVADAFPNEYFDYVVADLPLRFMVTGFFAWDRNIYPFGTPSNNDGTWLFIQHIIAKMKQRGRAVFTCLPTVFSEDHPYCSTVRSWMLDNDLIESIISLPTGALYPKTSAAICLCVLNKDKSTERKNKVQIINANAFVYGNKNRRFTLTDDFSNQIENAYTEFEENEFCHIANNEEFTQYVFKIYQPERDENGNVIIVKGEKKIDSKKTVVVSVPNTEKDVIDYVKRNILNHLDKEAWIDFSSVRKKCVIDIRAPFIKKPKILPLSVLKNDVEQLLNQLSNQIHTLSSFEEDSIPVTPQFGGPDTCLLGTVARFRRTRNQASIKANGNYPILTPNYLRGYISQPEEFTDEIEGETLVNEGDTLVLLDGDNAGEVFYGKKGYMSRTMAKVDLDTNLFNPEYFYYLIKSVEPELRNMAKGNAIKHLTISDLRSVQLTIPSLVEQITVVRYLNPRIKALNKLIPLLGGEARETLLNYRQALITEAINPKN
jgi:type I restriction enzyme M protein